MARPLQLIVLLAAAPLFGGEEISALYLSWYGDPATTMTIQWHTPSTDENDTLFLEPPGQERKPFSGTHLPFPGEQLLIHTLRLDNLQPDTEYHFQIKGSSENHSFRTAPTNLDKPLRFIIGGDVYSSAKLFRKMSQTAAALDPLFAVLGSDIAYAIDNPLFLTKPARRWRHFLAEWQEHLRTPSGRLIPFLIVSGNHDIAPDNYELYFSLFAFPKQELYRSIDFGSYLSLILLDTDHFQPIEGRQTLWLKQTLSERTQTPYLLAIYHQGAYPSFYSPEGAAPKKIRTHWCPLFDEAHLQAAFEHHSHAFKKTYPLKGNQKDPSGTTYFGDGCWGTPPRRTKERWYLEKRGRKNNIYLVEMTRKSASVKAIGLTGDVLDETFITPHN